MAVVEDSTCESRTGTQIPLNEEISQSARKDSHGYRLQDRDGGGRGGGMDCFCSGGGVCAVPEAEGVKDAPEMV